MTATTTRESSRPVYKSLSKRVYKGVRENMKRGRRGVENNTKDDEDEDDKKEEDESPNSKSIVSLSDSTNDLRTVIKAAIVVPEEVTPNRTVNNCLISTITFSQDGNSRFIPKDFFYKQDQRVNEEYKRKYGNQ